MYVSDLASLEHGRDVSLDPSSSLELPSPYPFAVCCGNSIAYSIPVMPPKRASTEGRKKSDESTVPVGLKEFEPMKRRHHPPKIKIPEGITSPNCPRCFSCCGRTQMQTNASSKTQEE